MKKLTTILILVFTTSISFSQNQKLTDLIKESTELKLDMWDLTTFAEERIKDKENIAKFFYYWIGTNIHYDYETLNRLDNNSISNKEFWEKQDEVYVYTNRKAVCAGYAKLYNWFLDWVDIESIYITGHIRDDRNHFVELENDDNFRHAWNAIKIDGKWKLVDSTWGTSYDPTQSEFYFDIKPELAINTHFPENSKWQLLEKPVTLEEFNKSKFIKLSWFFIGFSDIPKLKEDNKYYYLVYNSNNVNNNINVKLEISINNYEYLPIENSTRIDQDGITYIRFEKKNIPKKAYYKMHLYQNGYPYYDNVMSFKTF